MAEEFLKLHGKKRGTPTMGGIVIIATVIIMVALSIIVQQLSPIIDDLTGFSLTHNLWNQKETYLVIFTLISVGIIGAIDDYLNVREIGRTK